MTSRSLAISKFVFWGLRRSALAIHFAILRSAKRRKSSTTTATTATLTKEDKERVEKHDKKIFEKSNKIVDENLIGEFLSLLSRDHSYSSENGTKMISFFQYF